VASALLLRAAVFATGLAGFVGEDLSFGAGALGFDFGSDLDMDFDTGGSVFGSAFDFDFGFGFNFSAGFGIDLNLESDSDFLSAEGAFAETFSEIGAFRFFPESRSGVFPLFMVSFLVENQYHILQT
jgi:hypothetical protein